MKIPQLKITIRDKSEDQATIDVLGEIGWEVTQRDIKDQLKEIAALETKNIVVNISSLGGFVDDGLAIHDMLASHKATIETNVTGMTASAATIIAQAGDKRKISDNALYLVHKGWSFVIGNVNDLEEATKDLKAIDGRIANIYAKRSGNDIKEMEALMNENNGGGIWLTADEAQEHGLVDEVFEPMQAAAAVTKDMLNSYGLPVPDEDMLPKQESKILKTIFNKRRINHLKLMK